MKKKMLLASATGLLLSLLSPFQLRACSSCGCTLNTDWNIQGLSTSTGWSVDIRYDYLNQNRLRSGSHSVSPADAAATINSQTNDPAEVEKYTKNNYVTATIGYNSSEDWGVTVVIPFISRDHRTFGAGSPDGISNGDGFYESSGSGIGDVRVIGKYSGFTGHRNLGLQLGVKLPTGRTDQVANDMATPVDPGLQLGTGTTDLIIGSYYHGDLNRDCDFFCQFLFQTALNHSTMLDQSYRPGNSLNVTGGVRYHGFNPVMPMLQINSRFVGRDGGEAGDQFSTGGNLVYLTPGLILPISGKTSFYSLVQIPVYQHVNGIQLTPGYIVSAGVAVNL